MTILAGGIIVTIESLQRKACVRNTLMMSHGHRDQFLDRGLDRDRVLVDPKEARPKRIAKSTILIHHPLQFLPILLLTGIYQ
jgi:hypothetical protein